MTNDGDRSKLAEEPELTIAGPKERVYRFYFLKLPYLKYAL